MNVHAAPTLDDLAAALGRARAAHERRPEDHRLYAAMLEAEVAYLNAELARRDRALGRERMRAAEIGRRLVKQQEARSAGGRDRDKQVAARSGGAATGTRDRRDARITSGHDVGDGARTASTPSTSLPVGLQPPDLIRGSTRQSPRRRRRSAPPAGVPLLDFAGVGA